MSSAGSPWSSLQPKAETGADSFSLSDGTGIVVAILDTGGSFVTVSRIEIDLCPLLTLELLQWILVLRDSRYALMADQR